LAKQIVLLSGPVASGKSELGRALVDRFGAVRISTREVIQSLRPNTPSERKALQRAGDRLDRETGGTWVAQYLERRIPELDDDATVVVDSVRIPAQIEAIRRAYGARVVHVHVTAPDEVLAQRYAERTAEVLELPSYEEVRRSRTERGVSKLAGPADVVLDTDRCRSVDVAVRAAAHLGFYGRSYERLVDVLIGGQFGSEGKGQVVAHLAREYDYLIRVGGPNAGHTVWWTPKPYTFHILPSGTLHSTARLIIPPGAVIDTQTLLREIAECGVDHDRLSIDPQTMIIEQLDRAVESDTLKGSIGSTAQGVGSATSRRVMRGKDVRLARDIPDLKPFVRDTREVLDRAFHDGARVLLEGVQGTGLSLYHGFYPFVTSRDSSVGGCLAEAGIAPSRVRKIVLVCRTYPIRVDNPKGSTSGPMGIDINWKIVADRCKLNVRQIRKAERTSTTKRKRRVAEFDWDLLRRAASLNAPTDVALTFADYIHASNRDAHRVEQLTPETHRLIEEVERVAAAPVSLIATSFGPRSIIDRRDW
jgi:adenylosuccinate synthase